MATPARQIGGKRSASKQVLTARTYIHVECGESTELSGPEFEATANPLNEIVQTQCSHCGEMDSIDQFCWADTGENIAEYIARHQEKVPEEILESCGHSAVIRRITIGAIVGAIIGIGFGVLIGLAHVIAGIVVGILAVLILGVTGLLSAEAIHRRRVQQPALEKYLGVQKVGELR